jgi:hypothetical protein
VDLEGATGTFGTAAKELPAIISNVKQVVAEVKGTEGTVGAFLNSPNGSLRELSRARAQFSRLQAGLSNTHGSVHAGAREDVLNRARTVMSRIDSVKMLVASPNTSLGRMRKDSTLLAEVADIRKQVGVVQKQLAESQGTAGRVMHDTALTAALGGAQQEMAALFADMKKHPLRYIRF